MTLERGEGRTRSPEENLEEIERMMRKKIGEVRSEGGEMILAKVSENQKFSSVDLDDIKVQVPTEPLKSLIIKVMEETGGKEGWCYYLERDQGNFCLVEAIHFNDRDLSLFFTRETTVTKKERKPVSSTWKVWREKKGFFGLI